eukprot:scaffold498119_cov18-Prasinocladus_malaysianus.AAC.1
MSPTNKREPWPASSDVLKLIEDICKRHYIPYGSYIAIKREPWPASLDVLNLICQLKYCINY